MSAHPLQSKINARLAAVQALYQMETSGAGVETVIREFRTHRFGHQPSGEAYGDVDENHFAALVRGVVEGQARIDRVVEGKLASNWKLSRLDATARAILRAAVFELAHFTDATASTLINEYVEIANAFFEGEEPSFINAVLDKAAREMRNEELKGAAASRN